MFSGFSPQKAFWSFDFECVGFYFFLSLGEVGVVEAQPVRAGRGLRNELVQQAHLNHQRRC